jgi:siderophore synthetase component
MSVHNGPAVSALLARIQAQDPLTRALRILAEPAAAGLEPAADRAAAQLGCILRQKAPPDAWVCAALGDRWPGSRDTLLDQLAASYPGDARARGAALLSTWLEGLCVPALRFLCAHGVALELHLQNTLVRAPDGRVAEFWARDLGGIRIHRGDLAAAGHDVSLDPASFIATDDRAEVTDKLGHCLFHAHLGTLLGWLARTGVSPTEGWRLAAARLRRCTDEWSREPGLSYATRTACRVHADRLLAPRCRAKALFRMRLRDRSSEYEYVEIENPLSSPVPRTAHPH